MYLEQTKPFSARVNINATVDTCGRSRQLKWFYADTFMAHTSDLNISTSGTEFPLRSDINKVKAVF